MLPASVLRSPSFHWSPLGSSLKYANRHDSDSCQIIAPGLGLGMHKILWASLKTEPMFCIVISFLVCKPYHLPKSDFLGVPLPDAGSLCWGNQCGAWTPCSLVRTTSIVIILPFIGLLPRGVSFDLSYLCFSYPSFSCFFFVSLLVENISIAFM